MPELNLVDILIALSLIVYVLVHMRDGFLSLTQRLISFLGALVLAFIFYDNLSTFLLQYFDALPGMMDAASFVVLFLIFQYLIFALLRGLFSRLPPSILESSWNRALAVAPALVDGAISLAIILFLLVIVPVMPEIKRPIEESRLGAPLINQVSSLEGHINQVFGEAAKEALSFITVPVEDGEVIALPYQPRSLATDEEAEMMMLELLNQERFRAGVEPLVIDQSIVSVARNHSRDMWQRQYFAHDNPDGETPFDRMRRGGVVFLSAGENLALARTVERAHEGLMNSPGHRRNILDPAFGRIGIGVIDGGIYGKMFTQNFAD